MKKFNLAILILSAMLSCLVLLFCVRNDGKINVLVEVPLSGDGASYGKVQQQGIEVALAELADKPIADRLNIIYGDTKLMPREAVNIFQQESARKKISAVLAISTAEVLALAEQCNEKEIVLLSPLASGDQISAAGPYVYRISPTDSYQGEELARAVLEGGYSSIAILYANDAWGKGLSDKLISSFSSDSTDVVAVESCLPNTTDLRSQLTKIKNASPQALVMLLYPGEIIPALKQFRELGLEAKIYGGDSFSHKSIYSEGKELAQGIIFTLPSQPDNETFNKFYEIYKAKFNSPPDVNAAAARDAIMVIAKAVEEGAFDGKSLKNKFDNFKAGFEGATGLIKWDSNGDVVSKKYSINIIKGDSYKNY